MAVLTDPQRQDVCKCYMEALCNDRESLAVLKADVRAAVDALDTWINSNAAAANTALPQPFRGVASQDQKARLMSMIIDERYRTGAGET